MKYTDHGSNSADAKARSKQPGADYDSILDSHLGDECKMYHCKAYNVVKITRSGLLPEAAPSPPPPRGSEKMFHIKVEPSSWLEARSLAIREPGVARPRI